MIDIDKIAQSFAQGTSRRSALGSLVSSALGALGIAGVGIAAGSAKKGKKSAQKGKKGGNKFAVCHCQGQGQRKTCKTLRVGSAQAVTKHLQKHEADYKGACKKPRGGCAELLESCASVPCCGDDLVCSHQICVEKNPTECGTPCWVGYDRTSGCAEGCLCVANEPGGYEGTCQPLEPVCGADECTSDEDCNQEVKDCRCRFPDPYEPKGICSTEDPEPICKAKGCHSDEECNTYVEGCKCLFEDPYDPYAPGTCGIQGNS